MKLIFVKGRDLLEESKEGGDEPWLFEDEEVVLALVVEDFMNLFEFGL